MIKLELKPTKDTPEVSFEKGLLKITGRSTSLTSKEFFEPLLKWIDDYISNDFVKTEIHIKLEFFNTRTSKELLFLLRRFNNKDCKILWYYEYDDNDIFDAGKDYQAICDVPFEFICYINY